MTTISYIIPTIGRESLKETLASIHTFEGDEILVIRHNPPSGHWGNAERQDGLDRAKCDYVAFIDDDDRYVPRHREIQIRAILENPGKPLIFKIQYPCGRVIWNPSNIRGRPPRIKNGNVSSQMFLFPNQKDKLARWDPIHSYADYSFVAKSGWGNRSNFIWRDEIIVQMGHCTSSGRGTKNIHAKGI
jgi:hypothetical protein